MTNSLDFHQPSFQHSDSRVPATCSFRVFSQQLEEKSASSPIIISKNSPTTKVVIGCLHDVVLKYDEFSRTISKHLYEQIRTCEFVKVASAQDEITNAELEIAASFVDKETCLSREAYPYLRLKTPKIKTAAEFIFKIADLSTIAAIVIEQVSLHVEQLVEKGKILPKKSSTERLRVVDQSQIAVEAASKVALICQQLIEIVMQYVNQVVTGYHSICDDPDLNRDFVKNLIRVAEQLEDSARDLLAIVGKIDEVEMSVREAARLAAEATAKVASEILSLTSIVNSKAHKLVLKDEQFKLVFLKNSFANLYMLASKSVAISETRAKSAKNQLNFFHQLVPVEGKTQADLPVQAKLPTSVEPNSQLKKQNLLKCAIL